MEEGVTARLNVGAVTAAGVRVPRGIVTAATRTSLSEFA